MATVWLVPCAGTGCFRRPFAIVAHRGPSSSYSARSAPKIEPLPLEVLCATAKRPSGTHSSVCSTRRRLPPIFGFPTSYAVPRRLSGGPAGGEACYTRGIAASPVQPTALVPPCVSHFVARFERVALKVFPLSTQDRRSYVVSRPPHPIEGSHGLRPAGSLGTMTRRCLNHPRRGCHSSTKML